MITCVFKYTLIILKQTGIILDRHGCKQVTSLDKNHKSYPAVKADTAVPHNKPENLILDSGRRAC